MSFTGSPPPASSVDSRLAQDGSHLESDPHGRVVAYGEIGRKKAKKRQGALRRSFSARPLHQQVFPSAGGAFFMIAGTDSAAGEMNELPGFRVESRPTY
jgi:hypothetical protein